MPKNIIVGLDIGTSTIKILVAAKKSSSPLDLEIISLAKEPSLWVRRGVVSNPEEVSNLISKGLEKIEAETGVRVDSVYVNVNGSHIFSVFSRGLVSVSRADQKISEEDVNRVLQAAQTFSLPSNREIIDVFPKEFIVDGQGGIKEVLGMKGVRLEVKVLVVAGFSPYLKSLNQAVLDAGLQILDRFPSPLAAARAVLTDRQRELGVALLDIGAGTSSLAVFEEGDLVHLAIFPIGSANITNDIAVGLKTDIEIAERIKIEYGSCVSKGNKKEKIEIGEPKPLIFSHRFLAGIVKARVSEIFEQAKKELKKISRDKLPAGVVLTGGAVKLPGIVELAKKELSLSCRIGFPKSLSGIDKDPSLATVAGLILSGTDSDDDFILSSPGLFNKLGAKIKRVFKIFIP